MTIEGAAHQGQALTANTDSIADADGLGAFSYQWRADGADIAGATSKTYTLGQAQVGAAITVAVSYADGGGAAESLTSDPTAEVANANDSPTGAVTITGAARQGQALTANADSIADADGLGAFSYQWRAGGEDIVGATSKAYLLGQAQVGAAVTVAVSYTDGGGGEDIAGATSKTYTLGQAQVGAAVTVAVSYADGGGAAESLTSDPTAEVANANDSPTGAVTITGAARQGQVLTANTDSIADADCLGAFSYQWRADGADIAGATSKAYTLGQAQVGAAVTVAVSYADGGGAAESLTSDPTAEVANANDSPTGAVTIMGAARQGQVLTANADSIADVDGLGAFSYQWRAGGEDIAGATSKTYTLGQAQVGAAVTVAVSYADGGGAAESLTSDPTSAVANAGVNGDKFFDELNNAVLPELARVIGGQSVSAIANRVGQVRGGSAARSAAVGGQSTLAAMVTTHGKALAEGRHSMKELLGGSGFVLPLNAADGSPSRMAVWGAGGYRSFGGSPSGLDWDGNLFGVHLGVDTRLGDDLLAGLMLSWSQSSIDYNSSGGKGEYSVDLTSISPYAGWSAGALDLWATVGYGRGDLEIAPDADDKVLSDIDMRTAAAGVSGRLAQIDATTLRLKGEAALAELEVEGGVGINALKMSTSRLRVAVEASKPRALAGGARFEPSAEVGARYDGGDGKTGAAAELDTNLRYADLATGLIVEGGARIVVGRDGYQEWGVHGLVRLLPGADGQGLSFNLSPGYGDSASGVQKIWEQGLRNDLGDEAVNDRDYGMRLDARLGYGLSVAVVQGRLTPYSELTLGATNSYRVGMHWKAGTRFDLNLLGERSESDSGLAEHAILLKGEMRF